MVEEIVLIKLFLEKGSYLRYHKYVKSLSFEKEIQVLLDTIGSYYKKYPDKEVINLEDFILFFNIANPILKSKTIFKELFSKLNSLEINKDLVISYLNSIIERHYASYMIEELTPVLEGTSTDIIDNIANIYEEYQKSIVSEKRDKFEKFVSQELDNLLSKVAKGSGLKWRLGCLNNSIGELYGGSLGHVFARPETGKTTFIASEATNFISQLKDDEIIVWFNNEEAGTKVQLRIMCALLGATIHQIRDHVKRAETALRAQQIDRLRVIDRASISVAEIESILKEHNVRVVIIDQGDKVTFSGDKDMASHEKLKALYIKFRELAKTYNCDIITVGQADSMAEGKKWLNLNNMDSSKVGKPAEFDYVIGIGKEISEKVSTNDTSRYIHVCKNKMNDGFHGRYTVNINPMIARYADLGVTQYDSVDISSNEAASVSEMLQTFGGTAA